MWLSGFDGVAEFVVFVLAVITFFAFMSKAMSKA